MLAIFTDISELKEKEKSLNRAKNGLRRPNSFLESKHESPSKQLELRIQKKVLTQVVFSFSLY